LDITLKKAPYSLSLFTFSLPKKSTRPHVWNWYRHVLSRSPQPRPPRLRPKIIFSFYCLIILLLLLFCPNILTISTPPPPPQPKRERRSRQRVITTTVIIWDDDDNINNCQPPRRFYNIIIGTIAAAAEPVEYHYTSYHLLIYYYIHNVIPTYHYLYTFRVSRPAVSRTGLFASFGTARDS